MSDHDQPAQPDNDTDGDLVLFWSRFSVIASALLQLLPKELMAEAKANCIRTGQHGMSVTEADDTGERIRLVLGGISLGVVERSVFADDAYFRDVEIGRDVRPSLMYENAFASYNRGGFTPRRFGSTVDPATVAVPDAGPAGPRDAPPDLPAEDGTDPAGPPDGASREQGDS